MATTLAEGLKHKTQNMVTSQAPKDKKTIDLEQDTVEGITQTPMTTDHGVRISTPDNWLKAVDDRQTGPSLLEDQIAREKVCGRSLREQLVQQTYLTSVLDPPLRP